MSQFADLLEAALEGSPEPRQETAFDQSLRVFECTLAAFASADGLTSMIPGAQELGIEGVCTVDDVKRAFRRLAFATHPDRPGGSHDAFLRAKKLLDEALTSPRPARKPERAAVRYAVAEPKAVQPSPVHSAYA